MIFCLVNLKDPRLLEEVGDLDIIYNSSGLIPISRNRSAKICDRNDIYNISLAFA